MPEKQLTIAGYAAGASLAAITLVYVFAPTFFIDGEPAGSNGGKKRGAVGLVNNANDCFINSTLQALSGLGDLRLYLIREVHRRDLAGNEVYGTPVQDPARKETPLWRIDGLQRGLVTQGLKIILDQLNERPLYKKTISANQFVVCLETAFRQRISRQQQDAQEFFQVVAERLCDEYHAGKRARKHAMQSDNVTKFTTLDSNKLERRLSKVAEQQSEPTAEVETVTNKDEQPATLERPDTATSQSTRKSAQILDGSNSSETEEDEEDGFPFEGKSESQIECLTCGFKPKASESTFCSLSLSVPQVTSTTLNECIDGMFKTEYIEDFKCEKCRLVHAISYLEQTSSQSTDEEQKAKLSKDITALREALESDPEQPPSNIELPDSKHAPKRKIARHQKITHFPKIMAIHLSRSIFDVGRNSMKNSAKVSFPERLPLGGILNQKRYKLLGVVTHKGSHHSGHYESFRRQNMYAPFSTPNVFGQTGAYSKSNTPTISTAPSPRISASKIGDPNNVPLTPLSPLSNTTTSPSKPKPTISEKDSDTNSITSLARSARSVLTTTISRSSTPKSPPTSSSQAIKTNTSSMTTSKVTLGNTNTTTMPRRTKKKANDKWWRISDDKVKDATTKDVLSFQREVYLLFYELEREGEGES